MIVVNMIFNKDGWILFYIAAISFFFAATALLYNYTVTFVEFAIAFMGALILIKEYGFSRDDKKRKLEKLKDNLYLMHEIGMITADEWKKYRLKLENIIEKEVV